LDQPPWQPQEVVGQQKSNHKGEVVKIYTEARLKWRAFVFAGYLIWNEDGTISTLVTARSLSFDFLVNFFRAVFASTAKTTACFGA